MSVDFTLKGCALAALVAVALPAQAGNGCVSSGEDIGSALRVAYEHFDRFLDKEVRTAPQTGAVAFLGRIENYEIRIAIEETRYRLSFIPKKYPEGTLKGGGVEYTIKKCTHEVEGARPYM